MVHTEEFWGTQRVIEEHEPEPVDLDEATRLEREHFDMFVAVISVGAVISAAAWLVFVLWGFHRVFEQVWQLLNRQRRTYVRRGKWKWDVRTH